MLELIIGPMYAGKSTTLLSRQQGRTLIITHDMDNRGEGVRTHDGIEAAAMKCSALPKDLDYDTVLLDEAQFFDSLDGVEHLAPKVVVAGLNGDYLQRPFGKILDLIPKADKITFQTAQCKCGNRASFTKRISTETHTICICAHYEPVCGACL